METAAGRAGDSGGGVGLDSLLDLPLPPSSTNRDGGGGGGAVPDASDLAARFKALDSAKAGNGDLIDRSEQYDDPKAVFQAEAKAAADAAATKGSDKLLDRNDSDDLRARLAALDAPTAPIGGVAEGKSTDAGGGDGKQLSLDELQRRFKGLQG